ncbi:MAG: septum formation initiator family protein [Paracoccaceae bacterium]
MTKTRKSPAFGAIVYYALALVAGSYFAIAAVQGDHGVFRRVQLDAEVDQLSIERDRLKTELAALSNRTRRLSDEFLDLDLLDEQARSVLGMMRADEVVIR